MLKSAYSVSSVNSKNVIKTAVTAINYYSSVGSTNGAYGRNKSFIWSPKLTLARGFSLWYSVKPSVPPWLSLFKGFKVKQKTQEWFNNGRSAGATMYPRVTILKVKPKF